MNKKQVIIIALVLLALLFLMACGESVRGRITNKWIETKHERSLATGVTRKDIKYIVAISTEDGAVECLVSESAYNKYNVGDTVTIDCLVWNDRRNK